MQAKKTVWVPVLARLTFRLEDTMKRIAVFVLVLISLAWLAPARAQIYRGPNSAEQARKAGKKSQKTMAKQQRKAAKKLAKAQRKAAKRQKQHRA